MAVRDHAYRPYDGPRTGAAARRLVVPRYALEQLLARRGMLPFLVVALAWPAGNAGFIWLRHNLDVLANLGFNEAFKMGLIAIGPGYFHTLLQVQGLVFAFFVALFAGPGLVSPDLRDNALPLYLARPLTRVEYLVGKGAVLALLISAVTWVPLLLLWLLEAMLSGWGWAADNVRSAVALVVGSWLLIALFAMLALTMSALFKWRAIAGAAFFGAFVMGAPFGEAVAALVGGTSWGRIVDLQHLMKVVWTDLFGVPVGNEVRPDGLPAWAAYLGLVGACALCAFVLSRRVRAYEVVR